MSGLVDILKGQIFQYSTKRHMRNERVKKEIFSKFQIIKCANNEEMFKDFFSEICKSPITWNYVSANFFPQSVEGLKKYLTISYSCDFRYDFRWMTYCIKANAEIINLFVENRKKIDKYILFGQFEDALLLLQDTEKKCGISFWSCEYKIYLYNKLNYYDKDIREGARGYTGFLLECLSFKNLKNISYDDYRYVIEKQIDDIIVSLPSILDLVEYLRYMSIRKRENITEDNMLQIIKYSSADSIVDQYLLYLDICQVLIGKGKNDTYYGVVKTYIKELSAIKDDTLIALRFTYEDSAKRSEYMLKEGLLEAKESFIMGKNDLSCEMAFVFLRKFPYNIEAINLYVENKVLLNIDGNSFADTPLGMLLDALEAVYAFRNERVKNLERILKFANILSRSTWASAIENSILGRIHQIGSEEEKNEKNIVFAQCLDIETVCHNLEPEESLDFIEKNLDTTNAYICFRKLIIQKKYNEAKKMCELPSLRALMSVCDSNNNVQNTKNSVSNICGNNAIMNALIARCFLGRLELEKDYEIGLEVVTELIVNNSNALYFLPVETYIKYLEENDLLLDTISVPILFYVYYFYICRDKKDDLSIRCDDFFYTNSIKLPSLMKDYDKCGKSKLIFFLRYVCTTDVLSSAICEFKTSKELEKERIDICQLLCNLDKKNENVYEEEIREITQRLMINEELEIIEENRIHVNVDGIKRRIIENYKYDYLSYQLKVDERYQKYQRLLEFVKELGKNENNIVIFDDDNSKAENLLKNIVIKIRDAFVSSDEYGLDGYLSLNIRHGTLADELRSPLVNAKLLANYNPNKGIYEVDEKWLNVINNENKEKHIIKAITSFYMETEKIITDLKNKYIQVQTEKKRSEGCFDYCLTDEDFIDISMLAQNTREFEEFLDAMFDYLWKRTEKNLIMIKTKIASEISDRYTKAFDNLKADLDIIEPKTRIRELNRKINEAETDMQNVIEKVCFWFQRSEESKHTDFDLDFVLLMGLQTIHNMHPECKFIPKCIEQSICDKKIKGKYLKTFANIFYNIFDNIYQNAQRENDSVIFEYLLRYEDGNIHILVRNSYDCSNGLSIENEKIEVAKKLIKSGDYLSKIKGEGGTGIPKIYKMISVDLNVKPEMNFGFIKRKNQFYIELKFRKE